MENGSLRRDHLEYGAERGVQAALEALAAEPVFPEEIEYLMDWAKLLFGRSGVGFAGLAPLTFTTLESFEKIMDVKLSPLEAEGLIVLTDALLNLGPEKEPSQKEQGKEAKPTPKWPSKKRG